jgi:hypothetical protein
MIKARGVRSSKIHRKPGEKVVRGYETDPIERHGVYINNIARGSAKARVAQAAYEQLYGVYIKGRKFGGIDPIKEKRVYTAATDYIEEQLRNLDAYDRAIAWAKAIATLKFLGFSGRSAIVNMTSMVTTAPTAIQQYVLGGKGSFMKINRELARAGKDYGAFMANRQTGTQEERQFLLEAKRLGWDNAQYTRDAMAKMSKLHGRAWNATMDAAMWMFGKTEQWNRGTTMLAAYRIAKQQGKTEAEARELAKTASDKAHGIYGRATLPAVAWGSNPAAKLAQMMYVYGKFSHNYLQMLWDLGYKKHNVKGAAYLLLSPVIIGGMASFPFKDSLLGALGKILVLMGVLDDGEDLEKSLWDWIRDQFGNWAEQTGRYGLFGAAGMDVSGSLSIGVGVPKNFYEWAGPIGGAAKELKEAFRKDSVGDTWRGAEHLLPAGFANVSRAAREYQRGVMTGQSRRVYDPETGKPYMPTGTETALRAAGVRSSRLATAQERLWESKRQAAEWKGKRDDIYEKYRNYIASPDAKTFKEIRDDVREYNKKVGEANAPGASKITFEAMRKQANEMKRATKKVMKMYK